ncbi:molybdopterin-dependent oxidoreductase [Maritimibacter sp. HL-12]|uniref:molybdopterin-dependent oxidoreductase n=1 Tax=Maritimibacter sp. HL-12 TaxID=1162418 RepID=UPI000A0F1081|nr:molybdopterin-dependent oxidoreductase [Maritimibacter sp. HL-12]SMH31653.1 tetrathionate reductase alpha subunit precursor [Maritimibacter sp. HL-12]
MTFSRRSLLLGGTAATAGAAMAYGFAPTARAFADGVTGKSRAGGVSGASWQPEYSVGPDGSVTPNPDQRVAFTMCMACTTKCGVRVRVDKASGDIIRVTGNPYSPLSADPHIPYDTPVAESFALLSGQGEAGLDGRATACGRGNAALAKYRDPRRILKPLKRAGPRGEGHWVEISWEQLIEEVVEGGDLFGEGAVEGLRAIRDLETPIDPENPEFGPKANQLVVMPVYKNGRLLLAARFAKQAFGTRNLVGHRSYCGLSMRAGYAAFLNNLAAQPHLKPDYRHARFMLFIGTAPGNAGNPFKLQGQLMARARAENGADYVVVDPVLTNSVTQASQERGRWQPIRPGTDGALVMAMIRWILENDRYDRTFLERPSKAAAAAAGEFSHSNATHLVIDSADAPDAGRFLRWGQLDPEAGEDLAKEPVCLTADGTPMPAAAHDGPARLFHDDSVELADGRIVEVSTALSLLRREAEKKSLAEYAADCGVAEARIVEIAQAFTSHGKQAAADCHGGTMHAAGFYTAYGVAMLNALVGNLNALGGTTAGGGSYKAVAPGPRYDLVGFPGKVKPRGVDAGRGGFAYEKTSEYKRKVAAGENPYPARAPWHAFSQPLGAQWLTALLEGYPYRAKALITWSSNPVYGVAGLSAEIDAKIRDPKNLPLIVSIDPFINETSTYADYIVPDRVFYEAWGWTKPWGAVTVKDATARWPVVDCLTGTTADGRHMDMETFFIDVAKRLGLPGFGDGAVPDAEGKLHPLNRGEEFWLYAGANVAFDGTPVPEAAPEEMALTGTDRFAGLMQEVLKPDEWRRVAYVLNRGGRFEALEAGYDGDALAHKYGATLQIWNETVATARNAMTGDRFTGCPTWVAPAFADGTPVDTHFPHADWPLRVVSTKSQLVASLSPVLPHLTDLSGVNAIGLNIEDAAAFGLATGDRVRLTSPGGSVEGYVLARRGVARGTAAIEHGFGHRELGARTYRVGDRVFEKGLGLAAGVASNDLGYRDPSSPVPTVLADPVVGSIARQAIPARIERLGA